MRKNTKEYYRDNHNKDEKSLINNILTRNVIGRIKNNINEMKPKTKKYLLLPSKIIKDISFRFLNRR